VEPEVRAIMDLTIDKNMVDKDDLHPDWRGLFLRGRLPDVAGNGWRGSRQGARR
jgi:hypothetical protein